MTRWPMPRVPARNIVERMMRFIGVGAINTLATFLLYQLLLLLLDYRIAYGLSFVAGVVFTAFASSRFVFGSQLTAKRLAAFALFYGLSFLLGLGLLILLVDYAHMWRQAAPVAVALVMLPFNYLGARIILGRPAAS